MDVQRISAFSQGSEGGNPAGVVLLQSPASREDMARIAAEVGYSETVFAVAQDDIGKTWRARYFSPESEVPFCGHATIALGAVLGKQHGPGTYSLVLNDANISVEAAESPEGLVATLFSPPTRSRALANDEARDVLALFGLTSDDLDPRLAPAHIHGGANHVVLPLKSRNTLAGMDYDLDKGRNVMRVHDLVTVMLVFIESDQTFVVRNAFASGGVLEDPATGAAAAAFAGYLRDCTWPHGGRFTIRQGEDMGSPSLITVSLDDTKGASVRVTGSAREIT
ncbi:PhzF family phenazine biosynthesis protein [Ruegeria sp. 2205SS24-7]|uniref:PhzF family phenazine biosynthesis protein n=1 Tax=Ruegeria discodermiae TaxID=3064389 RepID=UPI0027406F87|nr:PhzF family phenazine biosynthesis protein [Ruegeria sp. 2205SS24-7]MDP5218754.1 PhzF family phenazine biosynthesis protein [Ruegeria sp. 2205SS24-7]